MTKLFLFIDWCLKLVSFIYMQRNTIYARVDSALRKIRDTSEVIYASFMLLVPVPE